MHSKQLCALILFTVQFFSLQAYPQINIRHLFDTEKSKKNGDSLNPTQIEDAVVLQLENLRQDIQEQPKDLAVNEPIKSTTTKIIQEVIESLPELEKELESLTPSTKIENVTPIAPVEAKEHDEEEPSVHRPPILPHNVEGVDKSSQGIQLPTVEPSPGLAIKPPHSNTKPFYGAARLAFGQNPEVLPTTSTSTSTTITTVIPSILNTNNNEETDVIPEVVEAQNTKEILETDVKAEDINVPKSATRRSVMAPLPPKAQFSELFIKSYDGQYSPFDMAQYIYWTGDESGVANGIEELVQQGLMTRENALEFLHEIRVGIEYLQKSYENRAFPEKFAKLYMRKAEEPHAPVVTTEKPLTYMHVKQPIDSTNLANLVKSLDGLRGENEKHDFHDYDDAADRLEEILYKLAKVMFTQSLTHDEAQQELQKFTNFLERGGNLGVIPLDMQKKVLHILLSALSDTLNEHPELLPAARTLANQYNKIPNRNYGSINK